MGKSLHVSCRIQLAQTPLCFLGRGVVILDDGRSTNQTERCLSALPVRSPTKAQGLLNISASGRFRFNRRRNNGYVRSMS